MSLKILKEKGSFYNRYIVKPIIWTKIKKEYENISRLMSFARRIWQQHPTPLEAFQVLLGQKPVGRE